MAALRSRGVTRTLDFTPANRQRLEHVESEEEGEDLEHDDEEEDTQPPLQRRRLDAPAGALQAAPSQPVGEIVVEDEMEHTAGTTICTFGRNPEHRAAASATNWMSYLRVNPLRNDRL